MIRAVSGFFVRVAERYMPDALVIAVLLTVVAFIASSTLTPFTLIDTVDAWGDSFWSLLRFTGQMVLILALGHVLAHTRPVQRALIALSGFIHTAQQAYVWLLLIGAASSLLSWGLGLVAPAILARIVGEDFRKRGIPVHFPLLVFCGMTGSILWVLGITSSIPLTVNTPGHFLEDQIGLISVSDTIFTPWSMALALAMLVIMPLVYPRMAPKADEARPMAEAVKIREDKVRAGDDSTPAAKLETTRYITLMLALMGGVYLVKYFMDGGELQLDIINLIFLVLGLTFADSPRHYLELLGNAARVIAPFLIQYPMYAGLMGVIASSGLGTMLVNMFVSISTAETLPIWTFFSAGFLNLFVPSGGGQWAVQGPIVVEAARQLGTDITHVTMAVALGDTWTNTIQPLYMIPALAIAGLNIRDVMGYGVIALMLSGTVFTVALLLF